MHVLEEMKVLLARCGDSCLQSQHFGRPRWEDCLSLGILDKPGQYNETPSPQQVNRIIQLWLHVPVVPATWGAEVGASSEPGEVKAAVSRDCVTALQPGQQSKLLSQKQTNKQKALKNHEGKAREVLEVGSQLYVFKKGKSRRKHHKIMLTVVIS